MQKFEFTPNPQTLCLSLVLLMCLAFFACSSSSSKPAPDSPSGLTVTANSPTSVTVSWEEVSGATGYYIYRSENAYSAYTELGYSTSTSYTDNNLLVGTEYFYKVAAYNDNGTGAQSEYVSVTTQADSGPVQKPDSPTQVIAEANSESSITIGWGVVSGATRYYIYRSTSVTGTYTEIGYSNVASYTDTGLSSSTTYYYRVAAYNSGGTGSQSDYASATTKIGTPVITAKAASTTSITVSWGAVNEATIYYIYRSETNSYYGIIDSTEKTSYTDNSLSEGTAYYYKVSAHNNNSGATSEQSASASAATQLKIPDGVKATVNTASTIITVEWNEVDGATEYNIYRSEGSSSGTYTKIGTSVTSPYEDNALSSGTTYYYKVEASKSSNGAVSQRSIEASATTKPSTPTGLTAVANATGSIIVSWDLQGTSEYTIYRSGTENGSYTKVGDSETNQYEDKNLLNNTTYFYKVEAYNISGTSAQSDPVYAKTLPGTPTGLDATLNSTTSITISWVAVSDVTGYYVYRSESANGTYTEIGTSETNSYTDNTGLDESTTYYYKVAAYNVTGTGTQSNNVSARTKTTKCDNQTVIEVKINTQTWMKENLNCEVSGSKCYDDDPANCNKYGRLYDWATAMDLDNSCNNGSCASQIQTKHQGICPSGWHMPSDAEWNTLFGEVDKTYGVSSTSNTIGNSLKAKSDWNLYEGNSGNGADTYDFTALPGGYYDSYFSSYKGVGDYSYWWSASEYSRAENANVLLIMNQVTHAYYSDFLKRDLISIRCIKD